MYVIRKLTKIISAVIARYLYTNSELSKLETSKTINAEKHSNEIITPAFLKSFNSLYIPYERRVIPSTNHPKDSHTLPNWNGIISTIKVSPVI